MLDVMLGFKGVIAEFESRDRPGEFVPWLTELPFTFPWTKNDSFAEFVEFAAPSGPVRLKPPDVANPNWVVFEKLDRSDPATAAGTETGGVGVDSVARRRSQRRSGRPRAVDGFPAVRSKVRIV